MRKYELACYFAFNEFNLFNFIISSSFAYTHTFTCSLDRRKRTSESPIDCRGSCTSAFSSCTSLQHQCIVSHGCPVYLTMLSAHFLHSTPFTTDLRKSSMLSSRLQSLHVHRQRTAVSSRSRALSRRVCLASASSKAEKSAGAIALGLKAYEKADYNEAIGLFKEALKLPGSGLKQYRLALLLCLGRQPYNKHWMGECPCYSAETSQQLQVMARRFQLTTTSHVACHKQGIRMMVSWLFLKLFRWAMKISSRSDQILTWKLYALTQSLNHSLEDFRK